MMKCGKEWAGKKLEAFGANKTAQPLVIRCKWNVKRWTMRLEDQGARGASSTTKKRSILCASLSR
jgi:hypothetical protein